MKVTNNVNLNPYFVTGFTDAEGCFLIKIIKNSTHKLNWATTGRFKIELHEKDLELLKSLQSFFNGIGQVGVISTRKLAYFEVTKLNDIVNIIIPHFDRYPLQSVKKIDYELWKQCILLMANKEHLSQAGLEKIVSIKGAINRGLPDTLKEAFPKVDSIVRPDYSSSEGPLDPQWVSGFCDGDVASLFRLAVLVK
jgi:hypothetical protein